jgi:benzodiazapine receptor
MRTNKIIAILNGLGLAVTIVVTYTKAGLSARYPTLVTPAPFAFSIWWLIYLSLIGFVGYYARVVYRGLGDPVLRIGGWFLVTCVANCCWVAAIARADWHRAPAVSGTAVAVAVVLFISSSLHAWRNRAYGPFRRR